MYGKIIQKYLRADRLIVNIERIMANDRIQIEENMNLLAQIEIKNHV